MSSKRVYRLTVLTFTVIVLTAFSSWKLRQDNSTSGFYEPLDQAEATTQPSKERIEQSLKPPSTREINNARAALHRRMRESPNEYYDPKNKDPAYLANLAHHQAIQSFIHSTRKNDPTFRKLMIRLLENGYEVEEWRELVGILRINNMPVMMQYAALQDTGHSDQEIQQAMQRERASSAVGPQWMRDQSYLNGAVAEQIRSIGGITEQSLIDEILEIEFDQLGIRPDEAILGTKPNQHGDRLLTDSDWLDAEFVAAKARYHGPPRHPLGERWQRYWVDE